MSVDQLQQILNEDQAAKLLNLRPQTLALWRMQGRGPRFLKLGRLVRYRFADIEKWMERQLVETA